MKGIPFTNKKQEEIKMKKLAEKFRRFIKNEEGAEFLEVAAIIIGAVVVVAIIVAVYSAIQNKVNVSETVEGMELPKSILPTKP